MDKHIGTISILLSKREQNAQKLNVLLTDNSNLIKTRLGLNLEPQCIADCLGVIVLIVEGTQEEILALRQKIDDIHEAKVEASILI